MRLGEAAEIINRSVSMRDILVSYGINPGRIGREFTRIPCPIHRGDDSNFSYDRTRYRCFVCNSKGGVIKFVSEYCGLSWKDSILEINNRLNLNLPINGESDIKVINTARRSGAFKIFVTESIRRIENRIDFASRSSVEYFTTIEEDGDKSDVDAAYERINKANDDMFNWNTLEKQRLYEYADFLESEDVEIIMGRKVSDNERKKWFAQACKNYEQNGG